MTQAKVLQFDKRKIFFGIILSGILAMFLLYTYFLNATILHIVERNSIKQKIADTAIHISELESMYMKLSADITPESADSLGFTEPNHVAFVQNGVYAGFAKLGE